MNAETKAAMERLGKMKFKLIETYDDEQIGIFNYRDQLPIGWLRREPARVLGLRPGMEIAIYPVGHGEEK